MSREKFKEVDSWLRSMYDLLSLKTEAEDIEYTQKRIDLFEWLRQQAFNYHGDETFTGCKERVEELEDRLAGDKHFVAEIMEQNKRYRETLEFVDEELKLVLHSNKDLQVKMFYIENSKRKISEVLGEVE